MCALSVPKDLYLLQSIEDDNLILYRPSKGLLSLISPQTSEHLTAILRSAARYSLSETELSLIEGFIQAGFVDAQETPLGNFCSRSFPIPQTFSPHEVTLDITKKCNMRCLYCYARGGDSGMVMSQECGRTAIELCVRNAKNKGAAFALHFHGSGEPSQEFNLLKGFWDFAKTLCHDNNVVFKSSVITNGLIAPKILEFYAASFEEITLSIDGDMVSHDLQRRASNGHPTFAHVYATAKGLLNLGRVFNLRMTVTSLNVSRLEEIVRFYIAEFPGCSINLEPVTLVGRALENQQLLCDPLSFADHLYQALRIGIDAGATIFYSGVSGHSERQEFCAASSPSFCVSPDGSVTSCFSYSQRDEIKDLFIYGRYDAVGKRFEFDQPTMTRLQSLSIEHDGYCDGCFCKSHCIGDCPAIRKFRLGEDRTFVEQLDVDFLHNRRCATNRRIVLLLLNDLVRGRIKPKTQASLQGSYH